MESELDINAIQSYLDSRQKNYLRVLTKIKPKLVEYWKYDTCGISALYRVASRSDYQFGNELKTAQSIYSKILEKRKKENPSYQIDDVKDVIGFRLVCVYPSDVELVLNFLRSLHTDGFFGQYEEELQERETGYKAYHVNVALSETQLGDYMCEIQVLTMLEETWSYKAHDLIYKPAEAVTQEQKEHAKILSDILHACDQQSQLLQREITKSSEEENQRKELAKIELMAVIAKLNPATKKELCEIRDHILQNRKDLRYGDTSDVLAKLGNYIHDVGIDIEVCKVLMLLCTLREFDDLDQFAVDHIEKLIRSLAGDDSRLLEAYRLAGLSYYCLGIPNQAIERTEQALKISIKNQNTYETNRLKSNIAYFIADSNIQEKMALAKKYGKEAHEEQSDDVDIMDTYGYVKIVFGDTYEEVDEGLKKCEEAYKKDANKKLAAPYFELHRRKAYKRLSELQPSDISNLT